MSILSVLEHPTVIDDRHESLYRSYHILNLVEDLLAKQTPPIVVLMIVQDLRCAEGKRMTWAEIDSEPRYEDTP